ncbi:MAG TPA: hypothetical protein VHZ09_09985 [Acidobacteriaceae bacterium]|nr:hypothetical protein [Acidobacteriaceae bacterium]
MASIQHEARGQNTLFPSALDGLIPADPVFRLIEAFVGRLKMDELGFMRAEPAGTGAG